MTYHLVFDTTDPKSPRFIELEDSTGHSISAGEWRERKDGYVELVLPAPEGWQDIATAPRDGTAILVYFTRCGLGIQQCFYGDLDGDPVTEADEGLWLIDDNKHGPFPLRGYQREDATHWQPLPSPPKPILYEGEQS